MKTIGILGGMGPEATSELYLRLIREFQKKGAKYDSDFPEIWICNLPLPDVVESPENKEKSKEMLIQGLKKMETAGADFIAIPCNTVNCFIDEMRNSVKIPILSIPEIVAEEVKDMEKVGLLGTETTINEGVYDIISDKIIAPSISQQKEITKIIMNILSGNKTEEDEQFLKAIIKEMKSKGVEKVILGCTELPLLIEEGIDTIQILADAIIKTTNYINQKQTK